MESAYCSVVSCSEKIPCAVHTQQKKPAFVPDPSTLDGALRVAFQAIKDGAESETELGSVLERFGVAALEAWRFPTGKHPNPVLHSLVSQNLSKAVAYLVKDHGFDINFQRQSDLCTPLHLSIWLKQPSLSALLLDLGADPLIKNSYGENCTQMLKTVEQWRKKCENIVWLDFELDSLPIDALAEGKKPKVLECCVIITGSDLNVLEEKSWVVHCTEEEMKTMSIWHQKNFASEEEGGNGLFQACRASSTSLEELEAGLLDILQRHCIEKTNMLAGNSVHVDQQVLVISMPKVARWLSHRVLDVSVLNSVAKRWYPELLDGLDECYKTYNHRAKGDVTSSIEQLKFYRTTLFKQPSAPKEKDSSTGEQKVSLESGSSETEEPDSKKSKH